MTPQEKVGVFKRALQWYRLHGLTPVRDPWGICHALVLSAGSGATCASDAWEKYGDDIELAAGKSRRRDHAYLSPSPDEPWGVPLRLRTLRRMIANAEAEVAKTKLSRK